MISAVQDNKGRDVVTDYFKDITERLYPVGRLDTIRGLTCDDKRWRFSQPFDASTLRA